MFVLVEDTKGTPGHEGRQSEGVAVCSGQKKIRGRSGKRLPSAPHSPSRGRALRPHLCAQVSDRTVQLQ